MNAPKPDKAAILNEVVKHVSIFWYCVCCWHWETKKNRPSHLMKLTIFHHHIASYRIDRHTYAECSCRYIWCRTSEIQLITWTIRHWWSLSAEKFILIHFIFLNNPFSFAWATYTMYIEVGASVIKYTHIKLWLLLLITKDNWISKAGVTWKHRLNEFDVLQLSTFYGRFAVELLCFASVLVITIIPS